MHVVIYYSERYKAGRLSKEHAESVPVRFHSRLESSTFVTGDIAKPNISPSSLLSIHQGSAISCILRPLQQGLEGRPGDSLLGLEGHGRGPEQCSAALIV